MPRGRLDYQALLAEAKSFVAKEQRADFTFLSFRLEIGHATVQKVLRMLVNEGYISSKASTGRAREVLVDVEGLLKTTGQPPVPKTNQEATKISKPREHKTKVSKINYKKLTSQANGVFPTSQKVQVLEKLAKSAGPKSAAMLREIASDVKSYTGTHKFAEVLSD